MSWEDVATKIDETAGKLYDEYVAADETVMRAIERLEAGTATMRDAETYASHIGASSGKSVWQAYKQYTGAAATGETLDYDLLREVLTTRAREDFDTVLDYAGDVQDLLNEEAGLSLKALKPEYSSDRVNNLLTKLTTEDAGVDDFNGLLESAVENMAMSAVDEMQQMNMEAQYDAGLRPQIHRIMVGRGCDWCRALAGTYDYTPGMNKDVFRRHQNCRCVVWYDPGTGRRYQDVWSKRYTGR